MKSKIKIVQYLFNNKTKKDKKTNLLSTIADTELTTEALFNATNSEKL